MSVKLTKEHELVLAALDGLTRPDGEMCIGFDRLSSDAGLERRVTRRITRHFARKGWAEYHKGLWTEDGYVAGSGYCISSAGRAALASSEAP